MHQKTKTLIFRIIIAKIILVILALLISACTQENNQTNNPSARSNIITINNIEYKLENNTLTQLTLDQDNIAKFGVLADSHGHCTHVEKFAESFLDENVDGIIFLGDIANRYRPRYNPKISYRDEIKNCVEAAAQTNLPVYVIPGNHETKKDYYEIIEELIEQYNYTNIIDMSTTRIVQGDDFDLISNPYGNDYTFQDEGFKETENDKNNIEELIKLINQDSELDILISHQPPQGNSNLGIDFASKKNVGSENLNNIMINNNISISLSGHIHEAGGKAVTSEGIIVPENTFSSDLRLNPGSVEPWTYQFGNFEQGLASIITIEGQQLKYEILIITD
ncbi:hypothetical protein HOK51_00605 [Candidatus Woesearchaeota archaeon]|jgi:Icc-related predicted phosphoesterase|nr:hypothetical protein [Candidatus Woesearchaeota archaeon]MBT6518314.1 hypothetical protein [Candidatus Woesearchaeota archaeon]MBT7367271.1 hypothetical protein [Candidatus Woesearchaeota archaeon]